MVKLSVVIITYNEERNIERCLQSVHDIADEILVVDSFSTDNTKEICNRFNVRFLQHTFEGHIEQKNWSVDQARYNHILSLDADEELTHELKESIGEALKDWKYDGYYFNRLTNYCGQWIRHSSWYPARKLRLWDRRKGRWGGINPHDRFILNKGCTQKFLNGDLRHYSYYSISEHLDQINKFTDIYARSYFENGRRAGYFTIVFHSMWRGFRDFIIKRGILDGFYGLVISVNSAHETFLKYIKLRKLTKDTLALPPYRICFFNSARTWGGGEKWHLDVSTRLHEKGYKTLMITNKKSELHERVQQTDQRHFKVRISNLSFLSIYKIMKLARIFRQERVKTVILNLSADLKAAGIAARLAGVENIIYRRGSAIPISNSALNRFLFKKIVTSVMANSEETKRTITAKNPNMFDPSSIHVIYNGINFKKFLSKKATPFQFRDNDGQVIIGNAGRLVKQKGQKYLLRLAANLLKKNVDFKIVIAGDGPLKNDLMHEARMLGVDKHVHFAGFIEDIKSFMFSIDIFCLTSLWEGFGYVIAEALVCEKPVVAFNTSSNPEIISNHETGFLVDFENMNEFTDRVCWLIENKGLSKEFGARGKKVVQERFRIEETLQHVEDFLDSLKTKAVEMKVSL